MSDAASFIDRVSMYNSSAEDNDDDDDDDMADEGPEGEASRRDLSLRSSSFPGAVNRSATAKHLLRVIEAHSSRIEKRPGPFHANRVLSNQESTAGRVIQ